METSKLLIDYIFQALVGCVARLEVDEAEEDEEEGGEFLFVEIVSVFFFKGMNNKQLTVRVCYQYHVHDSFINERTFNSYAGCETFAWLVTIVIR